jgi:hypothetical protein
LDSLTSNVLPRGGRPSSLSGGHEQLPHARGTSPADPGYSENCAHQQLWFEDPVGIDVTRSEHDVTWSADGYYVLSATGTYASRWYSESGWRLDSHEYDGPHCSDPSCTAVEANGYSIMENSSFPCPDPSATWTNYQPNRVTTWGYGNATFDYSAYAFGGCSSWLTLYRAAWVGF